MYWAEMSKWENTKYLGCCALQSLALFLVLLCSAQKLGFDHFSDQEAEQGNEKTS
jgi:hypothetical protein